MLRFDLPQYFPFVGNNYINSNPKILLYASAENLTGYNGYLDDDTAALLRYRSFFEHSNKSNNDFFPNVHIAPISDGSLILVVFYLLKQLGFSKHLNTPIDLIESIAFSSDCCVSNVFNAFEDISSAIFSILLLKNSRINEIATKVRKKSVPKKGPNTSATCCNSSMVSFILYSPFAPKAST